MIAIGYLGDPERLPEPLKESELSRQLRKTFGELILNGEVLVKRPGGRKASSIRSTPAVCG